MPSPISKEMGRKPYINTKGIDGGYVNEMRRATQSLQEPQPAPLQKRSRGAVIDTREVISTIGLISEYVLPDVSWGIAFDASGGLYASISAGDILYRPSGGSFAGLGQTSRGWDDISVAPNGNVYCVDFGAGIYIRTAGAGDFTLLEAGAFVCVSCAQNGDIYAIKSNNIWLWNGSSFASLSQTSRNYTALTCAPNGDIYVTVYGSTGTGKVYIRAGGAGDFAAVDGDYPYAYAMASAPNGDVFHTRYQDPLYDIYIRAGGAGPFVSYFDVAKYTQCMAVSPAGTLYLSSTVGADNRIYRLNLTATTQPPKDTISQTHVSPERTFEPRFQNLKPYENRTYEEMQTQARSINYTGREQKPAPEEALPVLVGHIAEVFRFVRSGSPVVVDIPTDSRDPVSGVEIYARVDGFASVAPNGTSVIYNPGTSGNALLTVHTKSGQKCTVSLMAK